jgi:transposase InsO family protein
MTFGFVDEHCNIWPVRWICAVLGLSTSGYYAWRARPESRRAAVNRALLDDIRVIHRQSGGVYGAPRVHAALQADGRRVGRHRVARLMRRAGLRGLAALPRRVRTTHSRHGHPIAPNRLARNFQAAIPNRIWLADLTYIPTGEGWLYLAAILDMHTRKIVGWSMRETLHATIAIEALDMAIRAQRPPHGLIHHSDRGVQYAAGDCRQALAAAKIISSMSRKGDCLDNAPMESFFSSLKTELVHRTRFGTRAEARAALFEYIEIFYNRQRRHSSIGYRTPAQARMDMSIAQAA